MTAKTAGQKICMVAAAVLLTGAVGLLVMSCCRTRAVPEVPPLPVAAGGVSMPQEIEVVIAAGPEPMQIDAPGGGVWSGGPGQAARVPAGPGPWIAHAEGGMIAFEEGQRLDAPLLLKPYRGQFELQGRVYRGALLLEAPEAGGLKAVNKVDPEWYLRSVVGSEMYSRWPLNALMAQAVAARTYMLNALQARRRLRAIDLAYRGMDAEARAPSLAVELTEGIIMTYGGAILPAYFSSTCGGHTCAAQKVFGGDGIGCLLGRPCHWCSESTVYQWSAEIPAERILEALADPRIATVETIEPIETGPDGHARYFLINGSVRMGANAFRLAVGAGELRSTWVSVTRDGDTFEFHGRGWGHGVGLCQWGAYGLADEGYTWLQILEFYYPGAVIQRAR
jgi:stage II sporulation protein D